MAVAAVTRPRHDEIFREDPSMELPRQIPIEQLSKVREPVVVGHGHSNPPQVALGLFKVIDQFPDGDLAGGRLPNAEVGSANCIAVSLA